ELVAEGDRLDRPIADVGELRREVVPDPADQPGADEGAEDADGEGDFVRPARKDGRHVSYPSFKEIPGSGCVQGAASARTLTALGSRSQLVVAAPERALRQKNKRWSAVSIGGLVGRDDACDRRPPGRRARP